MAETCLETAGVDFDFGAVRALIGVDITVKRGDFLGIIGANGSGKTTLFNCITGFLKPRAGRILWEGRDLVGMPPHRIAQLGLVRTFQHPMLFSSATVRGNVEMAIAMRPKGSQTASGQSVDELLEMMSLSTLARQPANQLPYGSLRQLGVAMALAARPRLLLLDEPAAGLNDAESELFGRLLQRVRDSGVTLVVIDHAMDFLLPLVNRVVVMDSGRLLAEGTPAEVQRNPAVVEAYLGTQFGRGVDAAPRAGPRVSRETGEPRPLLTVRGLKAAYGAVEAIRGVDLDLGSLESVAILGPNGAGKTTLLRSISRLLGSRGAMSFNGRALPRTPEAVAIAGIAHVLEGRHIFSQLTVRENLLVPRLGRSSPGFAADYEAILQMFPVLKDRLGKRGGELSGGQQQSLAIARALLTRPKVLLMDEPSLGLAPVVIDQLVDSLGHLRKHWEVSLLIAEQSLTLAMELCDRYYLLQRGRVIHSGLMNFEASQYEILRAYLGATGGDDIATPEAPSRDGPDVRIPG